MSDKERLEDIKNSHLRGIHSLFGTPWVSMPKENFDWLIQQAEHRQKLLERLNKRGIEVRKLKSQLSRCREKIKKLEWNLLITKGTAEQSMRANKSNYELVHKLKEENKRLREALEFYADEKSWMNREVTILMDGEPTDVEDCPAIFDDGGNIARKALEGKMI